MADHISTRYKFLIIFIFIAILCSCKQNTYQHPISLASYKAVNKNIYKILKSSRIRYGNIGGNEKIYSYEMIKRFYSERHYKSAWLDENGITKSSKDLLRILKKVDEDALNPNYYHLKTIDKIIGQLNKKLNNINKVNSILLARLDILFTDAYLTYAYHMIRGSVNSKMAEPTWNFEGKHNNLTEKLNQAIATNNVKESLIRITKRSNGYLELKEARNTYINIAAHGGWPSIPLGKVIYPGTYDPRINTIRKRLAIEGYINYSKSQRPSTYNPELQRAIEEFQKRNGLDADAIIGNSTIHTLNIPVQYRIRQIEINMERMRWLPDYFGDRYIFIKIPAYELYVLENNQIVLSMKVVGGKDDMQTPIFANKMTYMVLNPTWNVPDIIATEEILPILKRDPTYLDKQNMIVMSSWDKNAKIIEHNSIDWTKLNENNFTYKLHQKAGPLNVLGQIKFMLPNEHDVYLHDTPSKYLFNKSMRNFSHGCIRVQKPILLAEYLLNEDPKWNPKKLKKALESKEEEIVRLSDPIPVYIVYLTTWIDNYGKLNFRPDIYEKDRILDTILPRSRNLK